MRLLNLCRLTTALVCSLGMGLALAATIDVAGVKFEDTIDQRGSKLVLNGAGTRYKAVFKVYAAGLYLPKKAGTVEEVIALSGHKRITITMLRDIDANELGKLFTRGVEDNEPKAEMSKLIPGLVRMGKFLAIKRNCLQVTQF